MCCYMYCCRSKSKLVLPTSSVGSKTAWMKEEWYSVDDTVSTIPPVQRIRLESSEMFSSLRENTLHIHFTSMFLNVSSASKDNDTAMIFRCSK